MKKTIPPLLSIIIPIYNVEKYLSKCLNSILSQTYERWEAILVDDGSTDGSYKLCESIAKNEGRILVYHTDNHGVSSARNFGIQHAHGEWITFVDADDLLLDNFLSSLFDAASQCEDIDIAYCGFSVVTGKTITLHTYKTKTYVGNEQIRNLLSSSDILYRCSPWAKLFRRSIMMEHHMRFDTNLSISEDRLFFYNYLLHARGIATTSYVGYIYGSFSSTSLKNKHFPIEMLSYRQEMMTNATHKIIDRFSLEGEDTYYLTEHLMKIMQASMQSSFVDTGFSVKTSQTQYFFFAKHFDKDLYNQLAQSKKWKSQLANNSIMKYILSNKFCKLNWKLLCNDLNLRVRMFVHRLLFKHDFTYSYDNAIKIINK